MEFKFNFSYLKAHLLQKEMKITIPEIVRVFEGDLYTTVWDAPSKYLKHGIYYYLIGFSPQKRFLQIMLNCEGEEIHFLDVKVADLEEITHDFFYKRRLW